MEIKKNEKTKKRKPVFVAFYEPLQWLVFSFVDSEVKIFEIDSSQQELQLNEQSKPFYCSFTPSAFTLAKHRLSQDLICIFGGENGFEIVVFEPGHRFGKSLKRV